MEEENLILFLIFFFFLLITFYCRNAMSNGRRVANASGVSAARAIENEGMLREFIDESNQMGAI
jgi:hypothetical protein